MNDTKPTANAATTVVFTVSVATPPSEVVALEVGPQPRPVVVTGGPGGARGKRSPPCAAPPPAQHRPGDRHRGQRQPDGRHQVCSEVEALPGRRGQHAPPELRHQRVLDLLLGLAAGNEPAD